MAKIESIRKVATVGELRKALDKWAEDMPLDERMVVFRLRPSKGERYEDKRGAIKVENDDGTLDE